MRETPEEYGHVLLVMSCPTRDGRDVAPARGGGSDMGQDKRAADEAGSLLAPPFLPEFWVSRKASPVLDMEAKMMSRGKIKSQLRCKGGRMHTQKRVLQ